ncbi:MAG: hypothetical protein HGA77_06460 [Chlorobiaceae bacterium]|nr:hypothetical protein [Chlorobiaceae bacterium]
MSRMNIRQHAPVHDPQYSATLYKYLQIDHCDGLIYPYERFLSGILFTILAEKTLSGFNH